LILVLSSSTAAADPKPVQLRMKRLIGESIHIADGEGAINRHGQTDVAIELLAGSKLKMVSTGIDSEHNLYKSYSTDDEARWKTTWHGTWSQTADTLKLDITLDTHDCKHTKTTAGQPPEIVACRTAAKQTQLVCSTEQIVVRDTSTAASGKKPPPIPAWRCIAKDSLDLAETRAQLVFGKTTCLQTLGGKGGDSYEKCAP